MQHSYRNDPHPPGRGGVKKHLPMCTYLQEIPSTGEGLPHGIRLASPEPAPFLNAATTEPTRPIGHFGPTGPTNRMGRMGRILVTLGLVLAASSLAPASLAAQTPPRSAEVVADEFNRGFQTRQWTGLVQRIHSDGLAYLRLAVDILIEYDSSGQFLELMIGESAATYQAMPDDQVVVRALRWAELNYPGMLSAFSNRRTTILGEVAEGDDRHVLYRTIQIVQGAVPQLRVVTLSMENGAWRVRDGQDITSLHTALRGIPSRRGGDAAPAPN